MFLLPSGGNASQGSTESDPVVLAGDTAERFRAFLSIAYAEPLEFQLAETRPDQLSMFIHCAHFTHKYNITPLFLAALKAIVHVTNTKPALDSKIYISLLELSNLCETVMTKEGTYKYEIQFGVEWCWIHHLNAQCPFPELCKALDAGEKYELIYLPAFCSAAYMEKMVEDASDLTADGVTAPFQNHPWLKATHRLRMLSGAWSLDREWAKLTANAPAFPPDYRCPKKNHATDCVQRWETEWYRAITSAKVLAHLTTTLHRRLELREEIKPAFESPCIAAAFKDCDPTQTLHRVDHFKASVLG
ncbi:hypothetical protein C8R44DRAFT_974285 [Mycena epipterygia]|nr:hypothetical protein C8R44DRAFT_974285 [Mycena epipterygia]